MLAPHGWGEVAKQNNVIRSIDNCVSGLESFDYVTSRNT